MELKLQETKKNLKEDKEMRRREREENHKHVEEEMKGAMKKKTMPIWVEESEQSTAEEEGEHMQDQEFA